MGERSRHHEDGLVQTPGRESPAAFEAAIARLLDHVDAEAGARRAAWMRYEAVARRCSAYPAVALPESAVPWMLPLRLRGVHRLVASLRARGYDAEACAHLWAALIPCGLGGGPTTAELQGLLQPCVDTGASLRPPRVVERFPRA